MGNKITIIIKRQFTSECQIVSARSKVLRLITDVFLVGDDVEHDDY